MAAVYASQYRTNALFRVLAFLDNTGAQSFALQEEVSADGHFLNPDRVFAEDTAIAAILSASLRALRANIRRLFPTVEEQHALLSLVGVGESPARAASTWDWTTWVEGASPQSTAALAAGADASESASSETMADTPRGEDATQPADALRPTKRSALPLSTTWSFLLCHPVSLLHYAEQLEEEIPYHLLMRLHDGLGVPTAEQAPTAFSNTPLTEQILIDGLDEWLRGCSVEEVRRIVLACGVQPAVLDSAFAAAQPTNSTSDASADSIGAGSKAEAAAALPDALVDFVVDVVFPVATAGSAQSSLAGTQSTPPTPVEGLQDWLILSYEKNREIVEVDEDDGEDDDGDDQDGGSGGESAQPRKLRRAEATDSLGEWQPEEGEEVLTADNLERYLRECPQRIPREILREKRRPISDAAITQFELENHYTAAELKKLVKDEVGSMTPEEATAFMSCPISAAKVSEAAKATRKAQFVEWVLAAHGAAKQSA